MAPLSDLELLSLVERAQEAKQGPIGPQGVGIRSIEQPTADTVIITLSDGRTKELRLTAGPKGDPGEAGKPGQDGKPGAAGSPGRAGAAGVGVAGAPGRDGISIDTAIVNGDGNLLLGLTDGNVLNVGRVVGPAGATGPTGPTGLPGRAGRDGNTIMSAPHAPSDDEGSEGDFFIDTSSPLFDFYAKGSSGWRKLTSLRAPQTPLGGKMSAGGGGGSGGGGGAQTTGTLPLSNPTRLGNARGLPDTSGLKTQADYNQWAFDSLESLAAGVPPDVDLSSYAKTDYVDQADDALSGRIQAVEQDYTTSSEFSTVSQQVTKNKNDIKTLQEAPAPEPPDLDLYATTEYVDNKTLPLPYRLGTDKAAYREGKATQPAVELVDDDDNFSNVKFFGTRGLAVKSDLQGITFDAGELQDQITTALIDQEKIQRELQGLQTERGATRHYLLTGVSMPQNFRPGQMGVSSTNALEVTKVGFGVVDMNENLSKEVHIGDIIEILPHQDGARPIQQGTRFTALSADAAPTYIDVEYISGDQTFEVGQQFDVYVYPQNTNYDRVSREYVDLQDDKQVSKTGDVMTNELRSKTGKRSITAFCIQDTDGEEFSWKIWSPRGSGTETKYVGNHGTEHWFQVYDEDNENPITSGKFGYQNYHFQGEPGVGYGGSDKHYFVGETVFFNDVTFGGKVEVARLGQERQGFCLKGRDTDGDEEALFWVYHNAGTVPDAVNYNGKIDSEFNVVNKKYVDDLIAGYQAQIADLVARLEALGA